MVIGIYDSIRDNYLTAGKWLTRRCNISETYAVIDFHTHLPYRYREPSEAAGRLLKEMDKASVSKAIVIAVEAGVETFKKNIKPREVKKAIGEVMDFVSLSRIPMLNRLVFDVEAGIEDHVSLIEEHRRPTGEVVEAARYSNGRLLPVASYCPDKGVDGTIEENLKPFKDDIIGVKIYPTLHFIQPNDSKLDKIYKYIANIQGIVVVHTGCDPGMWELPRLCRLARPKYVMEAAKKHKDLVFIIAHMGAYSALMPGIFFHEALEALQLDNVYADTSAVDPFFVSRAIEEVGSDKILFGSDYPYMIGFTIKDSVNEILGLDINERDKRAILYDNSYRLLKIIGRL